MRQNPPNARFWVWHNNFWAKLTIKPNETLRHFQHGDSEEGWWSQYTEWHYDNEQHRIVRTYIEDGCDCDGRLSCNYVTACPVSMLQADIIYEDDDGLSYPVPFWEKVDSFQYDPTAEAMGY